MTKDERFLVELYRAVEGKLDETVDPGRVAEELGLKAHKAKNIVQGLTQANLIKRFAPGEVALTERGLSVARALAKA